MRRSIKPPKGFTEDLRIQWLSSLEDLPTEFCFISGSGASIAEGLTPGPPGDLDIVATGSAWEYFERRYGPAKIMPALEKYGIPSGTKRLVVHIGMGDRMGEVEILNRWLGQDPIPMIDRANSAKIEKKRILIASLEDQLMYRERLFRQKDVPRMKTTIFVSARKYHKAVNILGMILILLCSVIIYLMILLVYVI